MFVCISSLHRFCFAIHRSLARSCLCLSSTWSYVAINWSSWAASNRTVQCNPETVSLQLLYSTSQVFHPSWAWSNVLGTYTHLLGHLADVYLTRYRKWYNLYPHSVQSCWCHCRNYLELWKATQIRNCGRNCGALYSLHYWTWVGLFSGGSSNGAQGAWAPFFSYQNINIHYCVHVFFCEYH